MSEFLKLAFGALASAAVVAGILLGLISWLSRLGKHAAGDFTRAEETGKAQASYR